MAAALAGLPSACFSAMTLDLVSEANTQVDGSAALTAMAMVAVQNLLQGQEDVAGNY